MSGSFHIVSVSNGLPPDFNRNQAIPYIVAIVYGSAGISGRFACSGRILSEGFVELSGYPMPITRSSVLYV